MVTKHPDTTVHIFSNSGNFMEPDQNSSEKKIVIPLFPLPTTVFYPNTDLPLHIFEPRYRSMVADALDGKRNIGMVLLKPGWEKDYHGTPDIQAIGCVGKIENHAQLPDGKYNILLSGLQRFHILHEIEGKLYRQAQVELLVEINDRDLTNGSFPIKDQIIKNIYKKNLYSGFFVNVNNYAVHRLKAISDILLYEVSTPHLNDVIRLADDKKRKDGRIAKEHTRTK